MTLEGISDLPAPCVKCGVPVYELDAGNFVVDLCSECQVKSDAARAVHSNRCLAVLPEKPYKSSP